MSGHVAASTERRDRTSGVRVGGSRLVPVGLAISSIWVAVMAASIWAPTMITGSNHEQLAIAALADWLWGGLATGLLLLAAAFTRPERTDAWPVIALITIVVWLAVALASVFAPTMVTGTDPTTIPLATLLAPIAGTIVTAFLAVFAAGSGAHGRD